MSVLGEDSYSVMANGLVVRKRNLKSIMAMSPSWVGIEELKICSGPLADVRCPHWQAAKQACLGGIAA